MANIVVREIEDSEKDLYNAQVSHVVQSWEWGEFRKKTGLTLARVGHFENKKLTSAYQLTFHPVPIFGKTIGYLPKGPMLDKKMVDAIASIAVSKSASFVKIEPNVIVDDKTRDRAYQKMLSIDSRIAVAKKSLFTKYNFLIDLTKPEGELFNNLHPKTRYNVGLGQRYGVQVYESTRDEDFQTYLSLYFATTKRQKYFGHTPAYHKLVWETLMPANMARVIIAKYNGKPLVAWMLFNFRDTLYYPYGGSSSEHREVMASNLICWEAIRLGKRLGLKIFDMWGALEQKASERDPWFGFHRFKAGYGPTHVEYIGTYDLILEPTLYKSLNFAEKFRWMYLKTFRK